MDLKMKKMHYYACIMLVKKVQNCLDPPNFSSIAPLSVLKLTDDSGEFILFDQSQVRIDCENLPKSSDHCQ